MKHFALRAELIASGLVLTVLGCSTNDQPANAPAAGGATDTTTSSGGSTPSAVGTSSGAGGTSSGAGGTASTGGAKATGGSGGTDSQAEPVAAIPSAGCGKSAPTSGARTLQVNGETGNFLVSLPSAYDADTPYPLGFAFHGFGRTHEHCQNGDCAGFQSVMEEHAILVYMKSFGEGWEQQEVRDDNADFFEAVLDTLTNEACVDEARVFVAGTSSGAHFTNVLACRYGDRLLAAAPVAGYLPESTGCQDNVAWIGIHGIDDPHVTFESGETARDFFLEQNGCSTETVPDLETVHAEIRASRDANETNQKCVDYQDCDPRYPVRWCEHSEGGYDDSTHGWPTAGGQLIWDFVRTL